MISAFVFIAIIFYFFKPSSTHAQGQVLAYGNNAYGQCNVPSGLTNVIAISAGTYHSLALKIDGSVIAWGTNNYGQCNVPSNLTNAIAISAGVYHSVALKNDGTVVAWGRNNQGQCNVPSTLSNVVSISAGFYTTAALTTNGTVIDLGEYTTKYAFPSGLNGAVAIAEGNNNNAYAITNNSAVVGWGLNTSGNLSSLPNGLSGAIAITAGSYFGTVLLTNNTVVQFGADFNGDTETPSLSGVVAVSSGGFSTMALMNDGSVNIWPEYSGSGYFNGVTYGANATWFFNNFGRIASVSTGNNYYLALLGMPPVLNIGYTNRNQVKIKLSGTPHFQYIIQTATNLSINANWQSLKTNNTDSFGNMFLTDSNTAAYPARYFRAIIQQ